MEKVEISTKIMLQSSNLPKIRNIDPQILKRLRTFPFKNTWNYSNNLHPR